MASKSIRVNPISEPLLVRELKNAEMAYSNIPPGCWSSALRKIDRMILAESETSETVFGLSGNDFCSDLTDHQRKLLAFELTRCHTEDVGRSMFFEPYDGVLNQFDDHLPALDKCEGGDLIEASELKRCLSHLGPFSLNAYSQFTTSILLICKSLAEDMMIAKKEQLMIMMAQASYAVSQQLKNTFDLQESLTKTIEKQDEMLEKQRECMKELQRVSCHFLSIFFTIYLFLKYSVLFISFLLSTQEY